MYERVCTNAYERYVYMYGRFYFVRCVSEWFVCENVWIDTLFFYRQERMDNEHAFLYLLILLLLYSVTKLFR
jgi:hypothetical protein